MIESKRFGVVSDNQQRPLGIAETAGLDTGKECTANTSFQRSAVHTVGRYVCFRRRNPDPIVCKVVVVVPTLHVRVLRSGQVIVTSALEQIRHVTSASGRSSQATEDRVAERITDDGVSPGVSSESLDHPFRIAGALQNRKDVVRV